MARGNKKIIGAVSPYIEDDAVLAVDLICAEVLRGARSEKDFMNLSKLFEDFDILTTSFKDVARLAFLVSRKGFNPPLADLYIANCALENGMGVITRDKHFLSIASVRKFLVRVF